MLRNIYSFLLKRRIRLLGFLSAFFLFVPTSFAAPLTAASLTSLFKNYVTPQSVVINSTPASQISIPIQSAPVVKTNSTSTKSPVVVVSQQAVITNDMLMTALQNLFASNNLPSDMLAKLRAQSAPGGTLASSPGTPTNSVMYIPVGVVQPAPVANLSSGMTYASVTNFTSTQLTANNATVNNLTATGTISGNFSFSGNTGSFSSLTVPSIIGGATATSALSLQGTTANGTATAAAIKFLVGNNGSTNALTINNNGHSSFGTNDAGTDIASTLEVNGAPGSGVESNAIMSLENNISNGTFNSFGALRFSSTPDIDFYLGKADNSSGSSYFQLRDDGGDVFTSVDDTGKMGIGTATPTGQLELGGSGQAVTNNYGLLVDDKTSGTNNYSVYTNQTAGANNYALYNQGTAQSYFAGNVGIGTGASSPANVLQISSTPSAGTPVVQIDNTLGGTTQNNDLLILGGNNTGVNSSQLITFKRTDGTVIGSVAQNAASTVAFNTSSDQRIKENITPTTYGLSDLMKINVDDFNYMSDPTQTKMTGFIAQNLYPIFPEAVTTNGDDGTSSLASGATPWMVDYSKLTPLLVKSVQDLNLKIQNLPTGGSTSLASSIADFANTVLTNVKNGVAYMKGVVTGSLTVGTSSTPTGITIYDKVTNNPYCVSVQNGTLTSSAGICDSQAISTSSVVGNTNTTSTSVLDTSTSTVSNSSTPVTSNSSTTSLNSTNSPQAGSDSSQTSSNSGSTSNTTTPPPTATTSPNSSSSTDDMNTMTTPVTTTPTTNNSTITPASTTPPSGSIMTTSTTNNTAGSSTVVNQ